MRYIVIVLLAACSFGILSTFVKKSYDLGFTVGEVVGSQTLFGAVLLWVLVGLYPRLPNRKRRRSKEEKKESRHARISMNQVLRLMTVGMTTGLTGILYYSALQYITASLAIILLFQFTWLGVLLEAIVKRSWPGREKMYALLVLAVGTIFASGLSTGVQADISWLGVGLALLSALTYTLFIWFSGNVVLELPALTRSAFMLTGSVVFTLLIFPPVFLFNGSLAQGLWLWGGLLALFGAVIPPLFFSIGVPHIGSGLATILGAIELPVAVGMAFFILNENVSLLQCFGMVAILIGVALPELMIKFGRHRTENF